MHVREVVLLVSIFRNTDRIAARQQSGAGWATNGLGVEVREPHALVGHLVDSGGLEVGRAEHSKVTVALVIGKDDDKVRSFRGPFGRRRRARPERHQECQRRQRIGESHRGFS